MATGNYEVVNQQWPAGPLPKLRPEEALRATRRLYRVAFGRPFKGKMKLTSGRRYTYRHWDNVFYVNPDRGWHDLVHDISHYAHRQLHPRATPHDSSHTMLERDLAEHVVKSGWLEGKLQPEPKAPVDKRALKLQRTREAIARWEAKERRARTALKKLRARHKRYDSAA